MSSSPAYAIFDAPLQPQRPPVCDAIRGLLGMANEEFEHRDSDDGRNRSNEVILLDTEVDGSRYRLVRMPESNDLFKPAISLDSQFQLEMSPVNGTERRLNVGEFRRVLVAERDKAARLSLQQRLQEWGFEVVPAKHGAEALRILEQQKPPELAILSRRLPGIDGVELCRRISDRAREDSPYVFILARRDERQGILSALDAGAADYLTTPFEAAEWRARLIVASRILRRQQSLISSRDQFRAQARNDSLTGVWNRRAILEILEEELNRSSRQGRSTGVLLVDLDHFKRVNDRHGHLVGDQVLQETGRRLSQVLRSYDFIGRYGGEEFLIVVPGSSPSELCELAERIRAAMEWEPIHAGQNKIRITLSVGATIATPGENSTSKVIGAADVALYKAKKIGRNRTVYSTRRSNGFFKTGLSVTAIASAPASKKSSFSAKALKAAL